MTDPLHDLTLGNDLAEKLRKLEALFARPGTEGERAAAASALERLRARLRQLEESQPPQIYRFSLPDTWSRRLFVALARRYGLQPYREHGQRRTTVMLRTSPKFIDETLWPEFVELQQELSRQLEAVTLRIIHQAVHADTEEAAEQAQGEGRSGELHPPGAGPQESSARERTR
ncbi:MAG: hypothetical protein ABL998_00340 [Planctomycetota bacterium]